MKKYFVALCAFALTATYAQAPSWMDSSYLDTGRDAWLLEITSTARTRLSCTFTIDGWAPNGNGPQMHQVHQQIGLVVPAWPGYGAAMVAHTYAPPHISNFKRQASCG